MTLLGAGHHAAVLAGAVGHRDVLTPGVAHVLAGGALHVLGGAGRLHVLPALLLALLRLLTGPHQRVVAVNQGLILRDLEVYFNVFIFDN